MQIAHLPLQRLVLAGLALFTALPAPAATKTWLAASGNWFDASNWSPAGTPAAGDTVILDNGGTMNINQPLGFSGTFVWVRGTLTSSAQGIALATNTVMEVHPGNYKILACSLFNEGLIRLLDGVTVYLDNGVGTARIVNFGTLESQSDDGFQHSGTGGGRIENLGLFAKTGGNGATSLSSAIPLINSGTVEARSGTIQLAAGTLAGSFTGAGVNHWAGNFLLTGSVNSSNVLVNGNLYGTNVSLSGDWTWQTGNLGAGTDNSFTLAGKARFTLAPGNYKILHCPLTNHGTVRLTGPTTLYLDNGFGTARLVNQNLLDSTGDDGFAHSGTGGGRVENHALFRKSGGAGATSLASPIPLVNDGTVEAQMGTLQIAAGTLSGDFIGAGLNHWAGSFTLAGAVNSSNVLVNANLYGTDATLAGNWTWQTGSVGPAAGNRFTLTTNALLTLIPGNYKTLYCPLTNHGTIRLTGPTTLYLDNGFGTARVANHSLLESTGDDSFAVSGTGSGVVDNRALFRKSGGAGVTSLSAGIPLVNTGTVEAQTGTLQIAAGTVSGDFIGAGVNHWIGNLSVSGSVNSSNVVLNANVYGTDATLSGWWTWQTGSLGPGASGSFTLTPGARLTLIPGNYKYLYCPLTNRGTISLAGNTSLLLDNGANRARLVNLGLLDSTGSDLFAHSGTGGGVIDNRGTFAKTGGGGTTVQSGLLFLNSSNGTVNVQVQTCELQNGDLTGLFTGSGKTMLTGTHTLRDELTAENLEMQSGNYYSSKLRLHGAVRWVTGNFFCHTAGAAATLSADAVLTLVPGNFKYLYGAVTNLGVVRLSGSTAFYLDNIASNTRLVNSGLLESAGNDTFAHSGTAGGVVDNRGTFAKTGGASSSSVQSGLLFLNASAGTVTVQSGSTLNLQNGLLSGAFNGPGKTILTGNHTLAGELTGRNLELQSGNFALGGASLHGAFSWVTGNLYPSTGGPGATLATDCTFTFVPGNFKYLHGTLTNRGAIQLTGNTALYLDNASGNARLANYGLVESLGDDLFAHSGTAGGVLENRGWWRKSAGTGSTTFGSGLLFVHGAALEAFKGSFAVTGSSFVQAGGTVAFRLNSDTDYGQIHFSGVAPLGGGLIAQVVPGYNPGIGATFTVATYGGTNGSYSAYAFISGHTWSVLTTNTFTRLTVTGGVPPGAPAVITRFEQVAAQTFDLHLELTPNAPYHLESSNEVGPGAAWQYLGSITSATSNYVHRHISVGNLPPRQFFRVGSP